MDREEFNASFWFAFSSLIIKLGFILFLSTLGILTLMIIFHCETSQDKSVSVAFSRDCE